MLHLHYHLMDNQPNRDDLGFATFGSAGLDLPAAINPDTPNGMWTIPARGGANIDTGLQVAIPDGCFGRVLMRSGHGFGKNLICHVGTIDSDYRGIIRVKVFNLSDDDQQIMAGERFAQVIVQQYLDVELIRHDRDLADADMTGRGDGGFGSTGA